MARTLGADFGIKFRQKDKVVIRGFIRTASNLRLVIIDFEIKSRI